MKIPYLYRKLEKLVDIEKFNKRNTKHYACAANKFRISKKDLRVVVKEIREWKL